GSPVRPIWFEKCLKSFLTAKVAEVKIQLLGVPSRWFEKIGAIDNGVLCCCDDENASTHSTDWSPSTTLPLASGFQASNAAFSSTARTRHCSIVSPRS